MTGPKIPAALAARSASPSSGFVTALGPQVAPTTETRTTPGFVPVINRQIAPTTNETRTFEPSLLSLEPGLVVPPPMSWSIEASPSATATATAPADTWAHAVSVESDTAHAVASAPHSAYVQQEAQAQEPGGSLEIRPLRAGWPWWAWASVGLAGAAGVGAVWWWVRTR